MEDIIRNIIKIENQAQQIIDDALEDKRLKEEEHKDKLSSLENKILMEAKKKVEQIREREFAEIQENENGKVAKCDKRIEEMKKQATENMEQWVDELVKRVVG